MRYNPIQTKFAHGYSESYLYSPLNKSCLILIKLLGPGGILFLKGPLSLFRSEKH